MIQIKKVNENELGSHEIYVNGKLFSDNGYYEPLRKVIEIDDFPELSIQEIGKMKAQDFPDNFSFSWRQRLPITPLFDYFEIIRKGKKITVEVNGSLDINSYKYDWLLWHPYKMVKEMNSVAKKKGYRSSTSVPEDGVTIKFDFKTEGTLGFLFDKAVKEALKIQQQADKNMLKLALKKQKN